jgi:MerR family transcriptional regulator/heat shock protein HspR
MKRKKAFFSISAVAKMFSVHQQTIRLYEKEGFISPKRSEGNTRLFSEEDINGLEEIIYLTHKLGINLAGVDMILKLQKKLDKVQKETHKIFEQAKTQAEVNPANCREINKENAEKIKTLFSNTQKELEKEEEEQKINAQNTAKQLLSLKNNKKAQPESHSIKDNTKNKEQIFDIKDWEVDYDE